MPNQGDFANLGWLEQHIRHRKRSSNFSGVDNEMDENENQVLPDEEDDEDSEFGDDHLAIMNVIENGDLANKQPKTRKRKRHPLPQPRRPTGPGQQTVKSQLPPKIALINLWFS